MKDKDSKSSSRGAQRRGDPLFIFILLIFGLSPVLSKKDKDFSKVVQAGSKSRVYDMDQEIPRSKLDVVIEEMILARLGDKYRRANVYDFYPLELPERKVRGLDTEDQMKLMDYYDYARKDLQKLNQSRFLRTIQLDFNLDGTKDYAVIIHDIKHDANYLAIMNREELLHLDNFEASYLETVNAGHYPTKVIYAKGKKHITISTPAIRLVAFDQVSTVLYYDKAKNKWTSLELDE
jgi:hypothetical protein